MVKPPPLQLPVRDPSGSRLIRVRDARECCERSHKRMEIVTSYAIGILHDLSNWLGDNLKDSPFTDNRTLRRKRDDHATGTDPVISGTVTLPRLSPIRSPGRTVVPGPLPMPVYLPGTDLGLALPNDWFNAQGWQVWDLLDQTLNQLEPALQRSRGRAKKGTEQCTMKKALPQRDAKRIRVRSADHEVVASLRADRQRRRRRTLLKP